MNGKCPSDGSGQSRHSIGRAGFGPAAAAALLIAALAVAGCGLGPGAGLGAVELNVTRDYGAQRSSGQPIEVTESDTVMRVLDRNARISTRYGGGFVQSIDGVEGTNSMAVATTGSSMSMGSSRRSELPTTGLHGGEVIWWDYRDWSRAIRVPAVVGSWPQPFIGGYEGRPAPALSNVWTGARHAARPRSRSSRRGPDRAQGAAEAAIRVLVGPWERLRPTPPRRRSTRGPR